ncbi:FAD-dependent oxidoreductase [Bacillus sp. Marseille-P3661]|uniref:FAD-dependent oxidoreductase n=1 Tax=Bacillus sp. Marseille-P3661 TaxID=1936234 RepID=UPI000C844083|nr:FAD-dependent oxidoreductase [Bacillus sp. Marseille-P3661]
MKKVYIISIIVGVLFLVTISAFIFTSKNEVEKAQAASTVSVSKEVPKQRSVAYFKERSSAQPLIENFVIEKYHHLVGAVYDVVVIGSDPEGIAAAIAAAREGQKTLLLDKKKKVGGLYTLGKLNMLDINWSPTQENLSKGIFEEFFKNIKYRTSFDVKEVQRVFEEMIAAEENITIELEAQSILPIMDERHVESLIFKDANGNVVKVNGKQYIDSTPNADFAYLAGAEFTIGQEDYRNVTKMMAVTLVFELAGVDWSKVAKYLNGDPEFYTGADKHSAWGYGKEMEQYKPSQDNMRIRALNIGKQDNGNVLINAFQILGVNGLNEDELRDAWEKAERELPRITKFLRNNLVGFENVELVGTADEFYVRETRHLDAEYILTIDDVLEHRDFKDRIGFGSYPIDVQATVLEEGDIILANPAQYAVPFRSIVPKGFDNLLVASRSAGYDSLAHGSARTVPVGMVVGQAAGVAAAYSNEQRHSFQDIVHDPNGRHIKKIQSILNRNGAELKPVPDYKNPIVEHWAYEGVKLLRSYAIIAAGYDNEYKMDQPLSKSEFVAYVRQVNQYSETNAPIHFPFTGEEGNMKAEDALEFWVTNGLTLEDLSPLTREQLQKQTNEVTRDVLYMIIKELFEKL